ncbi:peptide/nickel transport system substrate-binding protein [Dethiosulfatibacter aminovorans DSM 17477]|uniref:Peptide/nickel transport system substrate-binding protein n=1 Tax=Dethiosulfatibacter aminovorans DSM 17477 TaxID=1121476 RepID=A0A1M6E613_9FIRM|nr:ABC transporter substrate-binding protein [Dethiosulfatibacter aminovorans]SHI80881.1 peptide/nickel transport system substrate-binding protein [Dethiosulfatibacter aminovorans DSM 17477]
MRRIFSLIMIIVLLVSFAGCGTKEVEESAPPETGGDTEVVGALNDNPLSDVRVRQAIAYAIDMDALAASLLEGKALPANSLTPNGPWKVDGLNNYEYNPDKARELLEAANWDADYELDVVYYYGDQLTVDLMTAIQAYLADVGMKMSFRKLEGDLTALLWTTPADPVNGPSEVDWDLAYAGIAALTMHEYYNRHQTGATSNSHTPGDTELDELIQATNITANIEEQIAAFKELQKYENENLFSIPLYYQQVFVYSSDRIDRKGMPYGNEQFAYDWRIIDWDIEADANGDRILYSNTGPIEFFETPFVNPGFKMPQKFLFDRLITADGALTPTEGQLAESYTVSDDGLSIEFVLRDGVTWHDGTPFTAEDVQFTVEYSSKVPQLNAIAQTTYMSLEGYEAYMDGSADHISGIVIDGNKVTFNFASLDPNALMTFSQWPPLPKHLLENTDPIQAQQASFWQAPVGTGPFRIEEVNMNDYATFVPYEGYWDEGTGNIEKIHLYPSGESDPNIVINAESNRLDYAYNKSVADANAVEKIEFMEVHPVDIRYTRLFYVNKFEKQ